MFSQHRTRQTSVDLGPASWAEGSLDGAWSQETIDAFADAWQMLADVHPEWTVQARATIAANRWRSLPSHNGSAPAVTPGFEIHRRSA